MFQAATSVQQLFDVHTRLKNSARKPASQLPLLTKEHMSVASMMY